MSEMIQRIHIYSDTDNVFDVEGVYEIPLYQRAYAWQDKEIIQLIEDIKDADDSSNYYIGSLVVARDGEKFEVVDGQQRLTTLFLLLNCLEIPVKKSLRFACRAKSNYTLDKIEDILDSDPGAYEMDRIEDGIRNGISVIKATVNEREFNRNSFLEKLKRVILYRIEVPENTDLNRYFEIMNTRGEQLEQHDILKANLMEDLSEDERKIFAKIWDACSDMTGYVQMHFPISIRNDLFGSNWDAIPEISWDSIADKVRGLDGSDQKSDIAYSISEIIDQSFLPKEIQEEDDDKRLRFESVIEFPFFLIHVLKVMASLEKIKSDDDHTTLIRDLIDDKKLDETFSNVIEHGLISGRRIGDDKREFAKGFITYLLVCRCLYDKYILKREYASDNSDGEWSIKEINVSSGRGTNKKPYYKNTRLVAKRGWETTSALIHQKEVMIQSALRVSYTSPKVMHWITRILEFLTNMHKQNAYDQFIGDLVLNTEDIARDAVQEQFFGVEDGNILGVNTPHIVFNYLDYLLWKKNPEQYKEFVFEFRNSVEHWYPQHPSEGTFEPWKDGVDRFGNLCLIQRNVNSKFSNMSPDAKKSTFQDMIAKGSLKLRLMRDSTTQGADGKPASYHWREEACEAHEKEMIDILVDDCYPSGKPVDLFGGIEISPLNQNMGMGGPNSFDAVISEYKRVYDDPMKNTRNVMVEAVRDAIKEYVDRGQIYTALNDRNTEYFVFHTEGMDKVLPKLQNNVSSWDTDYIYSYWLRLRRDKLILGGSYELGGRNVPDASMDTMKRIINIEKPSRDNLDFRYKRVYSVHSYKHDGVNTYEVTKEYALRFIQELLDHEKWLIEQLCT